MQYLREATDNLSMIADELKHSYATSIIRAAQKTIERKNFHLAVLGEFKRGKSSLVNSMLGDDYLPTDVLPNTAVITVIEYGDTEGCSLTWENGHKEEWPASIDSLNRLNTEGDVDASKVRHLVLTLQNPILKDGLVIIDTPGVNDISQSRAEVTYGILPHCDAALFLLDAAAPITRSEADFLTTKVLNHKIDALLFIISKSDRLDSDELEESLNGAKKRIYDVIGQSRKVIAYSSITVANQKSQNQTQTDLEQLLDQLKPLRDRATEDKSLRVISNLKLAIDLLLDELASLESLIEADEEHVRQFQQRLNIAQTEYTTRFERLKTSIEMVGRQTLQKMMDKSITRFFENLERDLDNQIRMQDQNVENFWQRVLPVQIERSLRQFSEAKASEIKTYIDRFISHLAQEYKKNFEVPLQLSMQQTGLEMPDWRSTVADVENSRVKQIVSSHLPWVIGGAIAGNLILPGIGPLIGASAGQILGGESNKKRNELKKTESLSQLPIMMDEISTHFINHTDKVINRWFDSMVSALEEYHRKQTEQMNLKISKRLDPPKKTDNLFNHEQVTSYKQNILHIREILTRKEK